MLNYKLFTGNANVEFANLVAQNLDTNICDAKVSKFSDGEINIQIKKSVRGEEAFIIQPTCKPTNDNLMEILLIADALKRSSAKNITAVIPYFGYARQDRKAAPRVPISAKLVADLLETSGVDRIVTMDLHAAQIQGFFNIPVDNLFGSIMFQKYVENLKIKNPIIASPDIGGVARARFFAKKLGLDIVIVDKRREEANQSEVMNIIGDVKNKDVILVDDMIDTAGTMVKAAKAFKDNGANSVIACVTHAVLSGDAIDKIQYGELDELIISDTLPLSVTIDKITRLSVAPLFSKVIDRIVHNKSVHSLFN